MIHTIKMLLKSKRFWKHALPVIVVVLSSILVLFYVESTVNYFRDTVLKHVFDRCVVNTKVFLYTIEEMKIEYPDEEEILLEAVKVRVKRYDEEYSVNSLLVDSKHDLVSERVVTDPFCDPFTMPVDSDVLFENLNSGKPNGYFNLHCPDMNGKPQACFWYYQELRLNNNTYYVLTGLQPTAITAVLDVNRIRNATFAFGMVIILSLWTAVYFATRGWRDDCARTRKGD